MSNSASKKRIRLQKLLARCERIADALQNLAVAVQRAGVEIDEIDHYNPDQLATCIEQALAVTEDEES